jgi:hypothetical protein
MSFKQLGVCHFEDDGDLYVAARSLFDNAGDFLKAAIKEGAGLQLSVRQSLSDSELFDNLLLFVKDNAYVVHRCTSYCDDVGNEIWWEFVDNTGRGHVRVWYIKLKEVERFLKGEIKE